MALHLALLLSSLCVGGVAVAQESAGKRVFAHDEAFGAEDATDGVVALPDDGGEEPDGGATDDPSPGAEAEADADAADIVKPAPVSRVRNPNQPDPEGADVPAAPRRDPVTEGVGAWLQRMDGEALPPAAAAEVKSDAAGRMVEAVAGGAGLSGHDIPTDFYQDPLAVLAGDPLHLDELDLAAFDIPIDINEHVKSKLRMYLGSHRKYMQRYLERRARYEPMILAELEKAGMPRDVLYLSMIESGFNPYAYSSAHASGLWQFIPTTGEYYNLHLDWWVDERRDPEKATKAAVKMLGELYRMFGDWQLAFAAYNTGPGRIRSAISQARVPDGRKVTYWDLVEQDLIHSETQGYVPKIIAAAIIGHNPERYGFVNLNPERPLQYDTVQVDGAVDIAVLATCAGVDEEAFRLLNPALRRYATPEGRTDLRVPKGTGEAFQQALAKVPPEERLLIVRHKVGAGETLSIIAGRYGTTAAQLASANGITNPNVIEVGQWLVVPNKGGAPPTQPVAVVKSTPSPAPSAVVAVAPVAPPKAVVAPPSSSSSAPKVSTSSSSASSSSASKVATSSSSSSSSSSAPATTHKVRSGDTLSIIADRYHVTVGELQKWNGISNASVIEVGQVLKVRAPASSSSTASTPAPRTYTVRAGDTLSLIADRQGVSLSDLQKWNGISNPSLIEVGQVLKVYGGKAPTTSSSSSSASTSSTPSTYKVRSGDTLSDIADRFGLSMSDLQKWNGISNPSSLQVGQTLVVKKPASSSSSSSSSSSGTWTTYTVRSGDSLGLIAERYGVSASDLRSWNKLSGSTIYPGQKLKILKK
jgi:membrane-bound lytic murein transglycosylase D